MTATSVHTFLFSGERRELEAPTHVHLTQEIVTVHGKGSHRLCLKWDKHTPVLGRQENIQQLAITCVKKAFGKRRHLRVQESGWCLNFSLSEDSISLKPRLPWVSCVIVPWELYFFVGKISSSHRGFLSSLAVILLANWKAELAVCRALICDGKMLTTINYFIVQQRCKIINWLFGR